MEIKGILEKIRSKEPLKKEFFFALEIDTELVKTSIWTITDNTVKILAIGDTQSWDNEENLIKATDASLSSVMAKIPPASEFVEPNKVVLGLPGDWITEDKIVAEKAQILKKVSKSLDLNPIGFVVITEAIIHHLKVKEGVPSTAIIVGLGEKRLTVSLVKLGKIIATQVVERSENLGADLNEGLTRFGNQEAFPARILLYGNKELEKARQELVNFPWQKEVVNFLHLPKVEILPPDFDIQAIALAGGKEITQGQAQSFSTQEDLLGFVKDKDITEEKKPPEKEPSSLPLKPKPVTSPRLNIVAVFKSWRSNFKKITLPKLPDFSGRLPLIAGVIFIFLLLIIGAALAFWWYLPNAQIVIYVKPQVLNKDFLVKLNPLAESVDSQNSILPAKLIETEVNGEKTMATTGTKLVGEPAKGTLVIYNRTANQKTFNAGTEISGPNNLKFSLDDKVTVASESAGSDYTKIPGKSQVNATAVAIGPEGNLAAGSEFTIANFSKSDYVAKNESAMSGGSSREIQAVSKTDQEKLQEELITELKSRALADLRVKIDSQDKLVDESLSAKIMEKKFSQEIEAEAKELSLNLKSKFSALTYREEDFQKIIQELVKNSVLEGYEYKAEEGETSLNLKEITKDGLAVFAVHHTAKLLPKLDLEDIKNNIAGKYSSFGESYITSFPNVESVNFDIRPKLPIKIKTFPRLVKNIKIEVISR